MAEAAAPTPVILSIAHRIKFVSSLARTLAGGKAGGSANRSRCEGAVNAQKDYSAPQQQLVPGMQQSCIARSSRPSQLSEAARMAQKRLLSMKCCNNLCSLILAMCRGHSCGFLQHIHSRGEGRMLTGGGGGGGGCGGVDTIGGSAEAEKSTIDGEGEATISAGGGEGGTFVSVGGGGGGGGIAGGGEGGDGVGGDGEGAASGDAAGEAAGVGVGVGPGNGTGEGGVKACTPSLHVTCCDHCHVAALQTAGAGRGAAAGKAADAAYGPGNGQGREVSKPAQHDIRTQ